MTETRSIWPKVVLFLVSGLLSVGFLEFALRLALDPVDFLKPDRDPHPILGQVIAPGTGGHDALGFRNPAVPERPDIVVLGDSMTYGFAAPMRGSWPSWLERLSGRSVYNMGIGGYGPAEYAWLLESQVLPLDPNLVLVGLYFGNDLYNAYKSVHDRPHWADVRADVRGPWSQETASSGSASPRRRERPAIKRLRDWLRSHSMIMRTVEQSPAGQLVNAIGDTQQAPGGLGCHVRVEQPFSTGLKLDDRWPGIDLEYDGGAKAVKYRFCVRPGGDPARIRFRYRGLADVRVDDDGALVMQTAAGVLRDRSHAVLAE